MDFPVNSLRKLPRNAESWYLIIRKLRVWITDKEHGYYRPYALMIVNLDSGLILYGTVLDHEPRLADVLKELQKVMQKELQIPHRPSAVLLDDPSWMSALQPDLEQIEVDAGRYENPEATEAMVKDLETHLRGGNPELPSMIAQPGVTERLLEGFFSAAADYYRAEPWQDLTDEDLLKIQVGEEYDSAIVSVLGNAGIQYGLAVYWNWQKMTELHELADVAIPPLPPEGHHALFFEGVNVLAFDDLDLFEAKNWPVAGPMAYPAPMVLFPGGVIERPSAAEILWYECVLLALPELVHRHLQFDALGTLLPFNVEIPVNTSFGFRLVQIQYPAGG